jgi:hypothetical protein
MLPSLVSSEIKSNAEKKIFNWFRDSPETDSWIVLHSLGISSHRSLIYGEVDFLVLAPKLGIFALEVKGGRVKRENGIWYFTDKYDNTTSKTRGPFEQASDGIFSIMEVLKNKFGKDSKTGHLLFGSGVMFPDIVFDIESIENNRWQIFDKNDNSNIVKYITKISKNCINNFKEKYNIFSDDKLPDYKDVKQIADYLRGDFDKPVSFQVLITDTEREQKKLTDEQFGCLDALEDNPRCLIQGPAGTGKTILAIEDTFRSISKYEKIVFLCYNKLLGSYLKENFMLFDETARPFYVGTFHGFLLKIITDAGITTDKSRYDDNEYWKEDVPIIVLDALMRNFVRIDKIIIDEAQDLLTDNNLDIFDNVLKNGFDRGKWSLFGDFSNQSLYIDGSYDSMVEMVNKKTSFINYKLMLNCRNTVPIGKEIQNITGFLNKNYLNGSTFGPPVNYYTWKNAGEQEAKIDSLLDKLLNKEKISPVSITILSPFRFEDSVVTNINVKIKEYGSKSKGYISFCTIYSFKGLENSIILLIDIDSYDNSRLLYVGLSRAKTMLHVFESEKAHKERSKILVEAIK